MPIPVDEPLSPGWWLLRLARLLESETPRRKELLDRIEGNPPLPKGAEGHRTAYQQFQKMSRTNYAELVVGSRLERMRVSGIRTAAEGDDNGDPVARRIWKHNSMDLQLGDILGESLGCSIGYSIVAPDDDIPRITAESPLEVIHIPDPSRPGAVRAAAKLFHDDIEGLDTAFLYLPGEVHVAVKSRKRAGQSVRFTPRTWDWDLDRYVDLGDETLMPVIPFENAGGVGEFERHVDLLDRINHETLSRLVTQAMQAFRQRAIKGLPDEDDDGNEIDYTDVFSADPGAMWQLPAGADLWESKEVDLQGILSATKDDVKALAAVTRTPVPVLLPEAVNQSAEGAASAKEQLIFLVEDRQERAAEALRDLYATAFRMMGDDVRADRSQIEIDWIPAQRLSLSEKADADTKARGSMPWRSRMRHIWGFDDQTIEEMDRERAQDAILENALAAGPQLAGS